MDDQIRLQMRFESIQTGEILREVFSLQGVSAQIGMMHKLVDSLGDMLPSCVGFAGVCASRGGNAWLACESAAAARARWLFRKLIFNKNRY
jgi:hypothetical protein